MSVRYNLKLTWRVCEVVRQVLAPHGTLHNNLSTTVLSTLRNSSSSWWKVFQVRTKKSSGRHVSRPTERDVAPRECAAPVGGSNNHAPPRPAYCETRLPELIKAANTAGHADNAALSCVQNSFN